MSFSQRLQNQKQDTEQTAAAGTDPTVFPGGTLSTAKVEPGTLSARVEVTIATGSLKMTPSWQVSNDGSSWEDVKSMTDDRPTGLCVTSVIHLASPNCLSGKRYCRAILTSSNAEATTGDFYRISYDYLKPLVS